MLTLLYIYLVIGFFFYSYTLFYTNKTDPKRPFISAFGVGVLAFVLWLPGIFIVSLRDKGKKT